MAVQRSLVVWPVTWDRLGVHPALTSSTTSEFTTGTAQFETGDPTLGGERNYNVDLTLRHVADHSVAEISVYNNQMTGYIYLHPQVDPVVTIRGTFPAFIYSQTNAVLRGIDGLLSHDFGDRFGMSVVGSLVRGRDTKSDAPPDINAPRTD